MTTRNLDVLIHLRLGPFPELLRRAITTVFQTLPRPRHICRHLPQLAPRRNYTHVISTKPHVDLLVSKGEWEKKGGIRTFKNKLTIRPRLLQRDLRREARKDTRVRAVQRRVQQGSAHEGLDSGGLLAPELGVEGAGVQGDGDDAVGAVAGGVLGGVEVVAELGGEVLADGGHGVGGVDVADEVARAVGLGGRGRDPDDADAIRGRRLRRRHDRRRQQVRQRPRADAVHPDLELVALLRLRPARGEGDARVVEEQVQRGLARVEGVRCGLDGGQVREVEVQVDQLAAGVRVGGFDAGDGGVGLLLGAR